MNFWNYFSDVAASLKMVLAGLTLTVLIVNGFVRPLRYYGEHDETEVN